MRIIGPGALVVLGQHDTHAVLSEGRVRIPPKPVGFFNLAHILETNLEVEEQNDRLRLTFALQLMMLAMQRHGHGGTILMGPTTGDAWLAAVRASHVFMAPTTSHLCQLMQDIAALQAARVADGVDAHREQFRRCPRSHRPAHRGRRRAGPARGPDRRRLRRQAGGGRRRVRGRPSSTR